MWTPVRPMSNVSFSKMFWRAFNACKTIFCLKLGGNGKVHKPMGASMKGWGSCLETINADVTDVFKFFLSIVEIQSNSSDAVTVAGSLEDDRGLSKCVQSDRMWTRVPCLSTTESYWHLTKLLPCSSTKRAHTHMSVKHHRNKQTSCTYVWFTCRV